MGSSVQLVEYNKWRDSFIGSKRNTIIADDGNCEGYMDVEMNGVYHKYFFVLDVVSMKLRCYHDNPKRNSSLLSTGKDLVDILYISKVSKCKKSDHGFCFEIHTPSKVHKLSTKIQAEMTHWVAALTKAATNPTQSTEDHSTKCCSVESESFTTSIIGGVVVKTPVSNTAFVNNKRNGSIDHRCVENHKNKSNNIQTSTTGVKNIIEGWSWKQGAVMKNWKRRYFRLNTIKLSYYENDKVIDPIRSIPASNINNVRILGRFCGRDDMVEVETPARKFYMHVDDHHTPTNWKDALEQVMIQNGRYLPRTKSV